jgi:hypothetical protein
MLSTRIPPTTTFTLSKASSPNQLCHRVQDFYKTLLKSANPSHGAHASMWSQLSDAAKDHLLGYKNAIPQITQVFSTKNASGGVEIQVTLYQSLSEACQYSQDTWQFNASGRVTDFQHRAG